MGGFGCVGGLMRARARARVNFFSTTLCVWCVCVVCVVCGHVRAHACVNCFSTTLCVCLCVRESNCFCATLCL